MNPKGLPYEEAAERRDNLSGWVCKTCRRYWGEDEHHARWCCASTVACDCGKRIPDSYTLCADCRQKKDDERFFAAPRVEWDGETPLCVWHGDRYFFDADDVYSYLDSRGIALEDARLELCVRDMPPRFDMNDHLADYLDPEGDGVDGADEIDKLVNDWIEKHAPKMWTGSGEVVSVESLRAMWPDWAK